MAHSQNTTECALCPRCFACRSMYVEGNTKSKVCKTTRAPLTAHMTRKRGLVLDFRAGILFTLHRLCTNEIFGCEVYLPSILSICYI